jgi:hypothetical protein
MGRSWMPWFFVANVIAASSFAACSSDDSATPDDAGVDAGRRDARSNDATIDDASSVDAQTNTDCAPCGELLGNGLNNPHLSPACSGSLSLYEALIDCACNVDLVTNEAGAGRCDIDSGTGDGGLGACKDVCPYAARAFTPTNSCVTCEANECDVPFFACFDDGMDAGDGG